MESCLALRVEASTSRLIFANSLLRFLFTMLELALKVTKVKPRNNQEDMPDTDSNENRHFSGFHSYIQGVQVKSLLKFCLITFTRYITFSKIRYHSIANEMA